MRKVRGTYYELVKTENVPKWESQEFALGYFHQWGTEAEEFENGAVQSTMAIVELPDGKVVMVSPRNLQFIKEDDR